ncbi:MAG: carboxypeptidase-like regulatory domain-containing protein [Flavobacteriales bacterium]
MKSSVTTLLFVLILQAAQSQFATIKGVVTSEATGEKLVGAVVHIPTLGIGTMTNLDGAYELQKVPAGMHRIVANYISYQEGILDSVLVQANSSLELAIALSPDAIGQGIQVKDFKKTSSESAVVMEMKTTQGVLVGVSAKQISKTPDQDAANVAKRIPGVTIVENRFIMVRGLQERYNAVCLNGILAPSQESDVKSFSFDLIPAGLIDRMLIYKIPTADIQGEFAGGYVNLITKEFPDKPFEIKVNYLQGFRAGTTGSPFTLNANQSNKDAWALGEQSRSLPSDFPTNINTATADQLTLLGRSLGNDWSSITKTAPMDQRANAYIGGTKEWGEWTLGSATALNYSRTYQTLSNSIANYNVYDFAQDKSDTTEYYTDSIFSVQAKWGAMQNIALRKKGHIFHLKNFVSQTGTDESTYRNGVDRQNGFDRKSYQFRYSQRFIYTGQMGGEHHWKDGKSNFKYGIGYNLTQRSEPDIRRMVYQRPLDDPFSSYQAVVAPSPQPFYMGRLFMNMRESGWSGYTQYERLFKGFGDSEDQENLIHLETGTYIQNKDRTFAIRNLGYRSNPQFDYTLTNLPIEQILATENISNQGGFILGEDTKGSDQYTASNRLRAGFIRTTIPWKKWSLNAGIRVEDNTQSLLSQTVEGTPIQIRKHVFSVLPSALLTYSLNDRTQIRGGYGKSLNRPEFRELAPFSFYDFVQNVVVQGNPNLDVPVIQNFDIRYEYYPSKSELISGGLFYKSFINPIEISLDPTSTPWSVDPYNAFKSYSYGIETDIRKSLQSYAEHGIVSHLSVVLNASYIKSRVTIIEGESSSANTRPRAMMNQSPYVVNAGIYYQHDSLDISFSALYNVIGPRIVMAGINGLPDIYEMPRNTIDVALTLGTGLVTQGKNKNFKVRFAIQDLLNQPYLWLMDANETGGLDRQQDQVRQSYRRGAYYQVGITYDFGR